MKRLIQKLLVGIFLLASVGIPIFLRLGWVKDEVLPAVIVSLLCLIVAMLSYHLAEPLFQIEQRIDRLTQEMISRKELWSRVFEKRTDLYNYLAYRINSGAKSWTIFTTGQSRPVKEKDGYQHAMEQAVRQGGVMVERISALWDEQQLNHLLERMDRFSGGNYTLLVLLSPEGNCGCRCLVWLS